MKYKTPSIILETVLFFIHVWIFIFDFEDECSLNDSQNECYENGRINDDFNNWVINCEPLNRLNPCGFSQTLNFDTGKSQQFKYLIDDSKWVNESESDQLVTNGLVSGEFNTLIGL